MARIRSDKRRLALYVLIGAAVLTWWWSRSVETPTDRRVEVLRQEPDYYLTDFVLTEMNEQGRPAHRLVADNLYHYPGREEATLSRPRLALYENDSKVWDISAAEGLVSERERFVRLNGSVAVRHLPDGGGPGIAIYTSELYIWPDEKKAETERRVRIEQESGVTHAVGMRADLGMRQVHLLSRVRGDYEP